MSTQWSLGGVHTATDVRYVENLASLSEVKGLKSGSRVAGRGQCAEDVDSNREGMRIALYLGPDRSDLLFAAREPARDMQTLSMLLTLELRRFAWYPTGAADVSPFFASSDEPGTMLVWTDADWKRIDVQMNVRWCCAAGVLWDRSVECGSAGGVFQLGQE